ncbi:acyltransferase [Paraglaciecola sp. 20A4]|uniref:acyltransferase family protein n=1 Tax=Paraglaciecola sp. 20A4 TaxID=2687288 RepID=UPI0014091FAD|nr:acyltransferase [Paraglaciecola sp. 20A4]
MRIDELTFFRFIAASIVVVFHFGSDATGFAGALAAGPQMVTFFFVLSGFVMGISYFNRDIINKSYWWARIARIMPVYLLAIVLMVLSSYLQGKQVNNLSLFLNLSLLQAWFPPHPLSINGPGWSLSVEAFFYLTFPFLLYGIKSRSMSVRHMMIASLFVWGVTQAITTGALSAGFYGGFPSFSHDLIYYFPLTHFCSFILGVYGAMWVLEKKCSITNNTASFFIVGMITATLVMLLNNESKISNFFELEFAFSSSFFAPIFLVFIVAVSICRSKLIRMFSARPLLLLGEASFSLYILQIPIHQIYEKYIVGDLGLSPLVHFTLFFIILTIASILSFILFEKPAMNFIRYSLPNAIRNTVNRSN